MRTHTYEVWRVSRRPKSHASGRRRRTREREARVFGLGHVQHLSTTFSQKEKRGVKMQRVKRELLVGGWSFETAICAQVACALTPTWGYGFLRGASCDLVHANPYRPF